MQFVLVLNNNQNVHKTLPIGVYTLHLHKAQDYETNTNMVYKTKQDITIYSDTQFANTTRCNVLG